MTDTQRATHETAFARIAAVVEDLGGGASGVEYARKLYLAEVHKGFCAYDCERNVMKAYAP